MNLGEIACGFSPVATFSSPMACYRKSWPGPPWCFRVFLWGGKFIPPCPHSQLSTSQRKYTNRFFPFLPLSTQSPNNSSTLSIFTINHPYIPITLPSFLQLFFLSLLPLYSSFLQQTYPLLTNTPNRPKEDRTRPLVPANQPIKGARRHQHLLHPFLPIPRLLD